MSSSDLRLEKALIRATTFDNLSMMGHLQD